MTVKIAIANSSCWARGSLRSASALLRFTGIVRLSVGSSAKGAERRRVTVAAYSRVQQRTVQGGQPQPANCSITQQSAECVCCREPGPAGNLQIGRNAYTAQSTDRGRPARRHKAAQGKGKGRRFPPQGLGLPATCYTCRDTCVVCPVVQRPQPPQKVYCDVSLLF